MATKGGDVEQPAKGDLKVDVPADGERSSPSGGNQITLERFNTPTRNVLKKFDDNGDGRIDANEIQAVVSTLVAEKFKSKAFKIGLIILGVFTVILLGAMFGLTWAVVAALKDTQVEGNVLVTNDGANTPIMTANMEMTVKDGKLVSRNSNSTITTSPLKTQITINVYTPFESVLKMQSLVFKGQDGSQYSINVEGVARVPVANSWELRVQTTVGTLTLNAASEWSTTADVNGTVLESLFKDSPTTGRRLLQEEWEYSMVVDGQTVQCSLIPGQIGDEGPIPLCYSPPPAMIESPPPIAFSPPPLTPPPAGEQSTGGTSNCAGASSGAQYSCYDAWKACYSTAEAQTAAVSAFMLQNGCQPNSGACVASTYERATLPDGLTVNGKTTHCQAKSQTTSADYVSWCCV